MKKHWWIALVLVFALAIPAAASQVIKIYVNGTELQTDVAAQNVNGRVMVPIRAIAEYFGKTVSWDANSKTVNISGLQPQDMVAAISEEWSQNHGNTAGAFEHAGSNKSCQPCHSGTGFQRSLSDQPYDPTFVAEGASSPEPPAIIDCNTCHAGVGGNILKTGVAPKELVNFAEITDKNSALCISCHNGRRDTADLYQKALAGNLNAGAYPHNATGAIYSGKGGMEYPDVTYANSATHQTQGCITCHMPKTEQGYTSHKFAIQESNIAVCQKCHVGQTEFSMGGNLKKDLQAKLDEVEKLAVAKVPGAVKIGRDRLEFPFADQDGKKIDTKLIPIDAYVAAYNFYMINDELQNFGGGAHNPQYAKSLLNESIKRLK